MKVIATKLGYFGKLREPGDEFEVPDGTKGSWFQPVEQKANGKGGKKPEAQANEKPADDLV
ncbi:MAG: hypothetical protein ACK4UX_02630 [Thiobacillus sp.]|jgi:hypothetical protein|nr:hypothetical protein [Rhodocyclaceae bacterium]